jgi:transketolase
LQNPAYDDLRALRVRRRVVESLHKASASHLGSNMSIVEILVAFYSSVDTSRIVVEDDLRDRVVVSKGHSAAATYATLEEFGIISGDTMDTYHQSGSLLSGHVSHKVSGVEHSTGALGHGLSVALGMAIGLRTRAPEARVLCVCGDGEIQEGSVWEALLLWSHLGLKNLIFAIDHNRISSITDTHKVINMDPPAQRFAGLGFHVETVDGHDIGQIRSAINDAASIERPMIIVCETVKGKGVSFAENEPIWHYRSLNQEHLTSALLGLRMEDTS